MNADTHGLRGFDYIVVGGGTAGCVLAGRLTEDRDVRVLLLEAGPEATSMWIKIPIAFPKLFMHPTLNWGYLTEPESKLENRPIYWPRGKVLGGSSSINGSAYVRGQAEDFDGWCRLGNAGWGWSDVLPYFERLERREGPGLDSRGTTGMLAISFPRCVHSSARRFIEAGVGAGLPACADLSGTNPEGVGLMPYSVHRGMRHSSAEAFLRPARTRPNLIVETRAFAHRIVMEGLRAAGVEYEQNGVIHKALARREVILAAGSINSPQLLLLSGIGPGQHLSEHGIPVVADLPGVGENMHDHPYVACMFSTAAADSLNPQLSGIRAVWQGMKFFIFKQGPLTSGASQACALARSAPQVSRPDLQIVFRPMSHVYDSSARIGPDPVPRITAAVIYLRPKSRGKLFLKSTDPRSAPGMYANYLSVPSDEDGMVAGVKWVRRIFQTEPLKSRVLSEDVPGNIYATDDEIRDFLHKVSNTCCHPTGTCKMGQDAMAVVDERLRVRGIESLRVIDASIMPQLPSAGPAPAVFIIAEKGADLIKADQRQRSNAKASVAS